MLPMLVNDTALIYGRCLRQSLRSRFGLLLGILMPLLYLLFFGPLLTRMPLPMTLAPAWLDALSHLVPLRYLVDAVRDAYVGSYATAHMLYRAPDRGRLHRALHDGGRAGVPHGRSVTTAGSYPPDPPEGN